MAIYDRNTAFKGEFSIPRPGSWVPRETRAPSIGLTQQEQWLADQERSKKPYFLSGAGPKDSRAPTAEPFNAAGSDTTDTGDDE